MSKPCIGIAGNLVAVENGPIPEMERAYTNDDYVRAVERAEGVPILLPVVSHDESIEAQIERCNGLLFSGGQDIHPEYYAGATSPYLGEANPRVDAYQLKLIRSALDSGKPILAICRGLQLLNVVCGGTLLQDLSEAPGRCLEHFEDDRKYEVKHQVKAVTGSVLENLLGSEFEVNSHHHQAIRDVGAGLSVTASSSDGVIEAVVMHDRDFVIGVQWHPERMIRKSDQMLVLFERLVQEAIKRR